MSCPHREKPINRLPCLIAQHKEPDKDDKFQCFICNRICEVKVLEPPKPVEPQPEIWKWVLMMIVLLLTIAMILGMQSANIPENSPICRPSKAESCD